MSECEDHLRQVICRMQESRNDLVSTLRQAARQLGYALVPLEAGADQHAGSEGMSELLPCPFCGSTDLEVNEHSYISCRSCDADGPIHCANTVAAWNRRATLPCWIPVEERLPDQDHCHVLMAADTGLVCSTFYSIIGHEAKHYTDNVSALFEHAAKFTYRVTHWMPLPAPPTQEKQK